MDTTTMTPVERALFEQAKKFALMVGKSEEQAIQEGLKNIGRVKKIGEEKETFISLI